MALRYVELNPVRAGMVDAAEQWPWSSAAVHCGLVIPPPMLEMERWDRRWTAAEWRTLLGATNATEDVGALRLSTHTGRPFGSAEFVASLEELTMRPLAPRKGGRPKRPKSDHGQGSLISVA
jgi:putative transposase